MRYAALVARQLAAIRAEDLEEFERLADQRDAAAAEIARTPASLDEVAHLALLEAAELDAQIMALLRQRRGTLRTQLRTEEGNRAPALAYARAAAPAGGSSFDVSL